MVISYKWFLVRATPDQQKDEDGNSVKEEEERTTPDKKEEEEDDGPFPITVHPMSGEVLPGEEQLINVSFSPLTVLDVECTLRCQYATPYTMCTVHVMYEDQSIHCCSNVVNVYMYMHTVTKTIVVYLYAI